MQPSTQHFVDRMRTLDTAYGSQEHQRAFVERMEWLQINHPCTKGCEEHHFTNDKVAGIKPCYSDAATKAAYAWQRSGGKL